MRWKHFGWWVSDGCKDGALIFFLAACNLNVHSAVCSILQYLAAAASYYTSNLNIHSAIVLCCSSVTYSLKLHFFPAAASTFLCFTLLCFQYFLCFTFYPSTLPAFTHCLLVGGSYPLPRLTFLIATRNCTHTTNFQSSLLKNPTILILCRNKFRQISVSAVHKFVPEWKSFPSYKFYNTGVFIR